MDLRVNEKPKTEIYEGNQLEKEDLRISISNENQNELYMIHDRHFYFTFIRNMYI